MAKKQNFNFDWDKVEEDQESLDNTKGGGSGQDDPRFYKVKTDNDGKFLATIRFLPPSAGEAVARVPYTSHYFKGKEGWYVELCPKTIGKYCPVCSHTYENYQELGKELAKKKNKGMYQKKAWVSNILVVDDKQNPENNGKVFLYKYGVTVKEIIDDSVKPEDPDTLPIKPFDFYKGADFRLNVYTKTADGFDMPQYDKCKFRLKSELLDGDNDDLVELYAKQYSLGDLITDDKFGEYEELKAKLYKVIGVQYEDTNSELDKVNEKTDEEKSDDEFMGRTKKEPEAKTEAESEAKTEEKVEVKETPKKEEKVDLNEVEDEDDFFNKLKNND